MANRDQSDESERHENQFATTHWSVIVAAGHRGTSESQAALVNLCESYWYPLYAYVRRRGHQESDAQDLIQDFFARLLENDDLHTADPSRGRFRSFILTILNRFISKQLRAERTVRRGGGARLLSLDLQDGEQRYRFEPVDNWTAERLYERRWALTVLERVLNRLEQEYCEQGKRRLFDELKVYLTPSDETPTHAEVADRLDMSREAVKVSAYRMRLRYRAALRDEVANTVASEESIRDELGRLLAALGGAGT